MMDGDGELFIDHYKLLNVSPDCDAKALETAYHYLAKKYHPDHTRSPDTGRFNEIIEAYKILRIPSQRLEYNRLYAQKTGYAFAPVSIDESVDEPSALSDAHAHAKLLLMLYERRREDAQNAGVVGFYLQDMLGCSDDEFEFHKWYLKEKGFVVTTEHGTLAITIQGVDHVIAMARTAKAESLQITQRTEPES